MPQKFWIIFHIKLQNLTDKWDFNWWTLGDIIKIISSPSAENHRLKSPAATTIFFYIKCKLKITFFGEILTLNFLLSFKNWFVTSYRYRINITWNRISKIFFLFCKSCSKDKKISKIYSWTYFWRFDIILQKKEYLKTSWNCRVHVLILDDRLKI